MDNASAMRLVQTPSTSTSWNSREKQSEIDNDHLDPLFHSTTEDFQPQPFVDSDEEESSGMYKLYYGKCNLIRWRVTTSTWSKSFT